MSKGMKGFQKGKNHYHWKKNPNYDTIHAWIIANFGTANRCEGINCKKISKNYNWCLKKGYKHERKIQNYIQLCISCHRIYDKIGIGVIFSDKHRENISKARKGMKLSKITRKKISDKLKGRISWNKDKKGLYKHSKITKEKIRQSNIKYWKNKKRI